jgi:hypothetical protein
VSALDAMLADPTSRAARATGAIRGMLRQRAGSDAFHPLAPQQVSCEGPVVIVQRTGRSGATARVLLNVSTADATIELDDFPVTVPALESSWL